MVAVATALSLSPPAAGQGPQEATYHASVPDLFPDRDDLDLGLDVTASLSWRLASGLLAPGAALDRDLLPVQGPLDVVVQYRLQRACCREQFVQGTRDVHDLAPLGGVDLEPLELEPGRFLALHLDGALRASLAAEGPGSVAPRALAWDDWAPRSLEVAAREGAPSGGSVAVRALSTYALDLRASLGSEQGDASATWRGDAPADSVLARSYPIAAQAQAAKAVPGFEVAGLALATLAALARRR
jgi:hypothetical protein